MQELTIFVDEDAENAIRAGREPVWPSGERCRTIAGWHVELTCRTRGWVRLLVSRAADRAERDVAPTWVSSFRSSDIRNGTWKTIQLDDLSLRIRLLSEGTALVRLLEQYVS